MSVRQWLEADKGCFTFWGDSTCLTLNHLIKTQPSSTITCQLWHTRAWLLHHVKPSNNLNETVSIHSSWSSNSTHAGFSPPEASFSHIEVNFQRVRLQWACLQLSKLKRPIMEKHGALTWTWKNLWKLFLHCLCCSFWWLSKSTCVAQNYLMRVKTLKLWLSYSFLILVCCQKSARCINVCLLP